MFRWIYILVATLITSTGLHAEPLKVATWNIANLHHETNVKLRSRAMERRDIDYDRLKEIADGLGADIVALQEIGSPAALERVFDSSKYHLVFSDRYQTGDENLALSDRRIFIAFAVSKSKFPTQPKIATLDAFSITHFDVDVNGNAEDRKTRAAMELTFDQNGKKIRILNLHLKSSCHDLPITVVEDQNPNSGDRYYKRFDCRTQKAQLSILENYIEMEKQIGNYVILAGDFNRRLNKTRNGAVDEFWLDLNDGTPDGIALLKGPEDLDEVCWSKHAKRNREHIDFVIVDSELVSTPPRTFKMGLGFDEDPDYQEDAADRNAPRFRQRLSDHCPVISEITLK